MWLQCLLILFCLFKPLPVFANTETETIKPRESSNFTIEFSKLSPYLISASDLASIKSLDEKRYRVINTEKLLILWITQQKIDLVLGARPEDKEALVEVFKEFDDFLEDFAEIQVAEIAYADYLIKNNDFVDKLINKKFSANIIQEPDFQAKKEEFLLETKKYSDVLLKSGTKMKEVVK